MPVFAGRPAGIARGIIHAMSERHLNISITSGTIVQAILLVILVALLFYLRDLVLILLTAIVLASAIEPGVHWFTKRRVPRVFSVLLLYLIVFGAIFGVLYLFIPPVLNEASNFFGAVPEFLESFNVPQSAREAIEGATIGQNLSIPDILRNLESSLSSLSGGFIQTVSGVFGGVLSFVLVIVFSFYFAMQETGIDDFLRVITPVRHQEYVVGLWRRSQQKIGLWMQGQLVLALIIGVLTYLGLTILGIRYTLLLAVLAAVAELIPVFGPIIAAVPAVILGFADGGTSLGLFVIGFYLIIQQFENHLIYPLVVKKVVGVPPLLVILALIIGAQVAGFLGILLSVPIAAAVQEFVSDIQRKKAAAVAHRATEV